MSQRQALSCHYLTKALYTYITCSQYTFSSFVGEKLVGAYFVGRLSVVLLMMIKMWGGRRKVWDGRQKMWEEALVGGHYCGNLLPHQTFLPQLFSPHPTFLPPHTFFLPPLIFLLSHTFFLPQMRTTTKNSPTKQAPNPPNEEKGFSMQSKDMHFYME